MQTKKVVWSAVSTGLSFHKSSSFEDSVFNYISNVELECDISYECEIILEKWNGGRRGKEKTHAKKTQISVIFCSVRVKIIGQRFEENHQQGKDIGNVGGKFFTSQWLLVSNQIFSDLIRFGLTLNNIKNRVY
jgi:hypothetical protein